MFDPSQMDPKVLMELSQLVQQLPPEKLNRMQSLMHNMMAGFDVRKDMEEFEKTLPPNFREKLISIMGQNLGQSMPPTPSGVSSIETSNTATELPGNLNEARLTLLRAVAAGKMTPEEALRLLFAG